jgi:acyl-ACP thioesterase
MKNFFEQSFRLRYFEVNRFGFASPTTVLTLLEETAAEHCNAIGYSLYALERQNIGWVLVAGAIEMLRYPAYREEITIRTWLSKYGPVRGYRENVILDRAGLALGKAKGVWAFYDTVKKRPVPIFKEIKEKWGVTAETSAEINADRIGPLPGGLPVNAFDIYRSDIDSNKHVNNIRYFHWLLESLPDEMPDCYFLKRIDAKFFSEARLGEKVHVYREQDAENIFTHTMRSGSDDKVFAAAYTEWSRIEDRAKITKM